MHSCVRAGLAKRIWTAVGLDRSAFILSKRLELKGGVYKTPTVPGAVAATQHPSQCMGGNSVLLELITAVYCTTVRIQYSVPS